MRAKQNNPGPTMKCRLVRGYCVSGPDYKNCMRTEDKSRQLKKIDAAEHLRTPEPLAKYLTAGLADNDPAEVHEALDLGARTQLPISGLRARMRDSPAPPADAQSIAAQIARAKKRILRAVSNRSPLSSPQGKIILFLFIRNYDCMQPSRLDRRGASRSSRTWRRDAVGVSMLQRGLSMPTNDVDAHGQVAWS